MARTLLDSLGKSQTRLLEHCPAALARGRRAPMYAPPRGVIGQILTLNVLRIQAVWSHHPPAPPQPVAELSAPSPAGDGQPHLGAAPRTATLARGRPSTRPPCHSRRAAGAGTGGCDKLRIARLVSALRGRSGMIIAVRPSGCGCRHFCWSYLGVNNWLEGWPADGQVAGAAAPQLSDQSHRRPGAACNGAYLPLRDAGLHLLDPQPVGCGRRQP